MYQKEEVERLAEKYVETGNEQVFETLIEALIPVIDVQLGKNYSSLKEFWDDLRQEVLLKLWKNKGGLKSIQTKVYSRHFYARIQTHLYRAANQLKGVKVVKDKNGKFKKEKIKMGYDGLNLETVYLEDLSLEEKKKLGIEPVEEEDYD